MTTMINAAECLAGMDLDDGWRVVRRIPRTAEQTGGNFCVSYEVERQGQRAFLKALNIGRVLSSDDPARMLQTLTAGFNFERDLLRKCGRAGMSKIVVSLGDGVAVVPNVPFGRVNYIVFEWAEGDIRKALAELATFDDIVALRALHHMAVGLKQLHARNIAHQDLKPSNVLQFGARGDERVSKLGDLGRSTDASQWAEHDEYSIAGDPSYAPPEQLYRATPLDFDRRRLACDLYQLGSMIAFVFTGFTFNGFLYGQTPASHHPINWSGSYAEVEPYIRDAFGHAHREVALVLPGGIEGRLSAMLRYLCDPDPDRRGHPLSLRRNGSNFGLERVVTELDLLLRQAQIRPLGRIAG